jgi:hypothetical protein
MGSEMDSWRGIGSRGSWWWPPAMLRGSRLWPPSLLAGLLVVAAGHACGAPGCGRRLCLRGSWWWPSEQQGQQGRADHVALGAAGHRQGDRRRNAWCGGGLTRMLQPATTSPDLLPTRASNIPGGWTCCSRRAPSTSLSRCCLPVSILPNVVAIYHVG